MSEELEGGGDSDETVVHDAYLNCLRSFASCKSSPHLSQASQLLTEDEANRFDVWAVNTGSHLNPSISSSLDHRLRNSNETRDKVILVLRAIRINLDYASRIFDQPTEILDETGLQGGQHGGGYAEQQALTSQEVALGLSNEALVSVHGFVSLLKRLSIAIRRASTDEYSVHAARARDVDKNGIDQGAGDELWAEQIVGVRYPDSPESLRKILSTAVSFRMRRFRDWKRHYERRKKRAVTAAPQLATGAGRPTPTEGEPSGGSLGDKGKGVGVPANDAHCGSAKPPDGVQESLAESKQSFQSANFEAPKSVSQSTTVSVGVRSTVAGVFIDWPNPPRGARNPGNGQVRCPYCFDLLDQREAGSKNKWRKHLTKDLEPYHCFYPECQTLLKMFPNEGQWVGHVRAFHSPGSWVCRMMPHTTAVILGTEGAFRKHLEDEHAGMYPKSRIDTLAKGSYRPATHGNLFDECPMRCPAGQAPPESATERNALVSHISNHLLLLALESLPERSVRSSQVVSSDDDGDSEGRMSSSFQRIRGTIQDGLESLPPFDSTDVSPMAEYTRDRGMPETYYEDYSHIPMVEHQRLPLDAVSQLKDPVMEKFFWIQKGVRVQTRRRWRVAIVAASFLSGLVSRSASATAEPPDLRDKIRALQKRPDGTDANFVPEHSLRDLFRNIDAQLKDLLAGHLNASRASDYIADLVTFICERAPKAFATLVFSGREGYIIHFYKEYVHDALLPVSRNTEGRLVSLPAEAELKLAETAIGLANGEIQEADLRDKTLKWHEWRSRAAIAAAKIATTFASWNPHEINRFCDEHQWRFFAPVFDNEAQFYNAFDNRVEMPFWPSGDRVRHGRFSSVEKWQVHRAHLPPIDEVFAGEAGRHPWVAVKVYKHDQFGGNTEFEHAVQLEAKFLNVMRSLGHPHLIRTVAYYRRGLSDCFVFPWADLGNLRDYWEQSNLAANPEKRLAKGYLWWVFVQLRGLADAITLLHDRHMRHGNLKPENILCFRKRESIAFRDSADRQPDSSCTLVIADAGLAGANYQVTQLRAKASLAPKGSTPTYEPPEPGDWSLEPVSRCYDVWSMGCIYLEFLIWLVDGGEGLKDFHAELGRFGRFYQRTWSEGQQGTTGVSRQPEVDRRIAMLRAHPFSQGEGNPLGRLVELIDTKLLVHIGIRTLPLHPSPAAIGSDVIEWLPGGRANSDTMFAELSEILADESSFELPSSTLNGFAAAEIDHRRL